MSTEVGLSFAGIPFTVSTHTDWSEITFNVGPEFRMTLSDKRELANGMTVGESQRAYLHRKLEEWIQENMK